MSHTGSHSPHLRLGPVTTVITVTMVEIWHHGHINIVDTSLGGLHWARSWPGHPQADDHCCCLWWRRRSKIWAGLQARSQEYQQKQVIESCNESLCSWVSFTFDWFSQWFASVSIMFNAHILNDFSCDKSYGVVFSIYLVKMSYF